MSLVGFALSLLILLVLSAYVFLPLLQNRTSGAAASLDKQRERALAYYERVLSNIRDLDDDHATGKIAADEYERERERWAQRGVQVLRLLDEMDNEQHLIADRGADAATIDAAIEESIAHAPPECDHQPAQEAS